MKVNESENENVIAGIAIGELCSVVIDHENQNEAESKNESSNIFDDVPTSLCSGVAQISCGYRHTLFLMNDMSVYATGWNKYGQCGSFITEIGNENKKPFCNGLVKVSFSNKNITQVAAGFSTSYAVTSDGSVYSWGDSSHGALGIKRNTSETTNTVMSECCKPRKIESLHGIKVTNISAGYHHCMVLTYDGKVYGWGDNRNHQVGLGQNLADSCIPEKTFITIPSEVTFPKNCIRVEKISCGRKHTLAMVMMRDENNTQNMEKVSVFGWGDASLLCQVDTVGSPNEIKPISRIQEEIQCLKVDDVQAGEDFSLVSLRGRVYSFGIGIYGQLGYGHVWDQDVKPVLIENIRNVAQIMAGYKHALAIVEKPKEDKELWSWGFNAHGQLGLGDFNMRLQPHMVARFKRGQNVLLAAGYTQSSCITTGMGVNDISFSNEHLHMKPRQYCLETKNDLLNRNIQRKTTLKSRNLADFERGSIEILYSCAHCRIDSICMVCARQCHSTHAIDARMNVRTSIGKQGLDPPQVCQCSRDPSLCLARWSIAREYFEKIAVPLSSWDKNVIDIKKSAPGETFIPLFKVRILLGFLRSDIQERLGDTVLSKKIMDYAWEDAIDVLGKGLIHDDEIAKMEQAGRSNCGKLIDLDLKSSMPVGFYEFERWYLEYFDMNESDDEWNFQG